jgi:hypothetical protein
MYETTAHTAGTHRLRAGDHSRFTQVSLTVSRGSAGSAICSITSRQVGGGLTRGRRLVVGAIPMPPGSLASTDPFEALYLAFAELTGRVPQ